MLPFSAEEFFALFARYNLAIWPAQFAAYILGCLAVWAIVMQRTWSWRFGALVLSAFWLWNGVVYHLAFFTTVNPAAYGFAALFVMQGLLFLGSAVSSRDVPLAIAPGACTAIAVGLLVYAMIAYSIIGTLAGHGWPRSPVFGVAPCPTTIFTLGLLILARRIASTWLAVIPILWALIGSTAAVLLGVIEDLGLLAAVVAMISCRVGR